MGILAWGGTRFEDRSRLALRAGPELEPRKPQHFREERVLAKDSLPASTPGQTCSERCVTQQGGLPSPLRLAYLRTEMGSNSVHLGNVRLGSFLYSQTCRRR